MRCSSVGLEASLWLFSCSDASVNREIACALLREETFLEEDAQIRDSNAYHKIDFSDVPKHPLEHVELSFQSGQRS